MAKAKKAALVKRPRRSQPAEAPPAPPSASSRLRRETLGERITVYLPEQMAQTLRLRCVTERRSVSDAVTEAVASWLNKPSGDK